MRTATLRHDIHSGSLVLINRQYPLQQQLQRSRLAPVDEAGEVWLEERAAAVFLRLLADLDVRGEIVPVSGYRSKAEQEQIYRESLLENGAEFTAQYVALPDCSEHQSGLAIDVGFRQPQQEAIDFLRPAFPYEGVCQRFRQRAIDYGFIERYPKGKEDVTGIAHEPWHFRYVGAPHARIICDHQLALEEYLALLKFYPYGLNAYQFGIGRRSFDISYLRADRFEELALPQDRPWQISGNNSDGYIVTLWRENE